MQLLLRIGATSSYVGPPGPGSSCGCTLFEHPAAHTQITIALPNPIRIVAISPLHGVESHGRSNRRASGTVHAARCGDSFLGRARACSAPDPHRPHAHVAARIAHGAARITHASRTCPHVGS